MILGVTYNFSFFMTNILLGIALAMDAFSVSIANAITYKDMKKTRIFLIAGTFAIFQAIMPLIGWLLVHFLYQQFNAFKYAIPYIALVLLGFIGGKMIYDFCKEKKQNQDENKEQNNIKSNKSFYVLLLIQGVGTSIDALSVGLNTAEYDIYQALVSCLIIAIMTFILCLIALFLGKLIGPAFGNKATLIGGIILCFIGCYIFVTGQIKLFVPIELIPDWLKFLF